MDHLLIHCKMAFELWSFIFGMVGIQWVLPEMVLDSLCEWWIMVLIQILCTIFRKVNSYVDISLFVIL